MIIYVLAVVALVAFVACFLSLCEYHRSNIRVGDIVRVLLRDENRMVAGRLVKIRDIHKQPLTWQTRYKTRAPFRNGANLLLVIKDWQGQYHTYYDRRCIQIELAGPLRRILYRWRDGGKRQTNSNYAITA